jgi:hypothetical protein
MADGETLDELFAKQVHLAVEVLAQQLRACTILEAKRMLVVFRRWNRRLVLVVWWLAGLTLTSRITQPTTNTLVPGMCGCRPVVDRPGTQNHNRCYDIRSIEYEARKMCDV